MLKPDSSPHCAVLYVDDEIKALKYFRMMYESKFAIQTASSAAEGLEILRRENGRIGIVISDQRMDGMQGAEFLGIVREENPFVVRILATAFSDLKGAIQAVNTGHIYQYICKPWQTEELEMVLRRASDYYRILTERNELLALKLTALQRILCGDRLKWLLLWSRSLEEPDRSAARRALAAFVEAMPGTMNPLAVGRASAGPRQFDIGELLRSEFAGASACLDALDAMRGSAGALDALVARLQDDGFTPGEIAVETGADSTFALTLSPLAPDFDAAAFEQRLFGLLIEKEVASLSVALFASLLAVARTNSSLTLSLRPAGTPQAARIFTFRLGEDSADPARAIEVLCEKFSSSDISRL